MTADTAAGSHCRHCYKTRAGHWYLGREIHEEIPAPNIANRLITLHFEMGWHCYFRGAEMFSPEGSASDH